jgi:hypothetical protein
LISGVRFTRVLGSFFIKKKEKPAAGNEADDVGEKY